MCIKTSKDLVHVQYGALPNMDDVLNNIHVGQKMLRWLPYMEHTGVW